MKFYWFYLCYYWWGKKSLTYPSIHSSQFKIEADDLCEQQLLDRYLGYLPTLSYNRARSIVQPRLSPALPPEPGNFLNRETFEQ